ncbi:MAG: C4-type zinc ribbon domain-containing protein [Desulfobulbaceae bacterium]|nr:C4-type zinc ribbon domain-containing protein [Desulfobulbaceae bacterium]
MNEEINKLVALQELDSEISGFDRNVRDRKQELADREQSIADKEESIAQFKEKVTSLDQQKREAKAEHDDAQVKIKERQNKMMQVQTSREHQALLKEIEDSKRVIKEKEEYISLLEEQLKEIKGKISELQNLCKGEKEILAETTIQVDKEIKKILTDRQSVEGKRDKLSGDLRPNLLKRYNMILQKRGGAGIVKIIDGVCQGCFMTLPPQQFNEIRKGDKLNMCPTCNRMLYFKQEDQEEAYSA